MKKLILLLFIPLVSFGQTFDDALIFLNMNEPEWACERYAEGTFTKRLEISTNETKSKLILKELVPGYAGIQEEYYSIAEIQLSKVIRIEAQQSNKGCAGIRIITDEYGIASKSISNSSGFTITTADDVGQVLINSDTYNEGFYSKRGWSNDQIRIKNDKYFDERAKRIINAIKFMAVQNGAQLKESYF